MSSLPLSAIAVPLAADVCARFTLSGEARGLLLEGATPREFVITALEKKQYAAAIDFLAHGLPPRAGIWWGCLCVRHAYGDLNPVDRAACRAAVQWIMQPTEESRVAAMAPSAVAGPASPGGWLAAAAFQTSGNVAPTGAPPAAPRPWASSNAIANAMKLAAMKGGPSGIRAAQKAFVELGLWVAEGNS